MICTGRFAYKETNEHFWVRAKEPIPKGSESETLTLIEPQVTAVLSRLLKQDGDNRVCSRGDWKLIKLKFETEAQSKRGWPTKGLEV